MQTEFDKAQAQISTMIAVNHIPLPITNDMGDRWVVVALTDEPLNTLIQRVQRVGGYANVFIPAGDRVVQFGMVDSKCAIFEDREPVKIYRDNASTVGQFVDTLRNAEGTLGLEIHDMDSPLKSLKTSKAKILTPA